MAEESFLEQLLDYFIREAPSGDESLEQWVSERLVDVNRDCGSGYVALFVSPRPSVGRVTTPHLLQPYAHAGLTPGEWRGVIHFNWRKFGLPEPGDWLQAATRLSTGITFQDIEGQRQLVRGARGLPDEARARAVLLVPVYLSHLYRGVVIFGANAELSAPDRDQLYLSRVAHRVTVSTLIRRAGYHLTELQHEWPRVMSTLAHEYRGRISGLSDAASQVVTYLESGPGPYDRDDALQAARHIRDKLDLVAHTSQVLLSRHAFAQTLMYEKCQVHELVRICIDAYVGEAAEKGISFRIEESVRGLPAIEVDRRAVLTALTQLIENAIKYSHEDKYVRVGGFADTSEISVWVEDFGQGYEQEDEPHLYDEGYQGRRSRRAQQEPGSGVGLHIAKGLIEAMGGKITQYITTGPRSETSRALEGFRVRFTIHLPLLNREA